MLSEAKLGWMSLSAMPDWLLLGFDARVARPTGMKVSVDAQDSPSAFDVLKLRRPDWTGPVQELWEDKNALEVAIDRHRNGSKEIGEIIFIAVAVLADSCSPKVEWAGRVTETSPPQVSNSWRFFGFDVADQYLESAITMFSSGEEQMPLNDFALLDDLRSAYDVRDRAARSFREQAPFCIYGVWEVL